MPFHMSMLFRDQSGLAVHQRDAAKASNLRYSYKLNGGDSTATFDLAGDLQSANEWLNYSPTAVQLTITDEVGTAIWRGLLLEASLSPDTKVITVTFLGMWWSAGFRLISHVFQKTDAVGPPIVPPLTLKKVIRWMKGLDGSPGDFVPLLSYNDSLVLDPGADFTNGAEFPVDYEYPRTVWQRLLQTGDGANQWHMAVWADGFIRLFPRDLTYKWSVWTDNIYGSTAVTISRQNLFSDVFVPWIDTTVTPNITRWDSYTDAGALAILGTRRDVKLGNPYGSRVIADQLAVQFLVDHKVPIEQGRGFPVGPKIIDWLGRIQKSHKIRPGDVIRYVNVASSTSGLSGTNPNRGAYYVIGVTVNVDSEQVTLDLDNPNPHLANIQGSVI